MKKIRFVCLVLVLLCCTVQKGFADVSFLEEARQLPLTALLDTQAKAEILDENFYTKISLAAQSSLTLQADAAISYLYLVWDSAPEGWILRSSNGQETAGGQNGFLHECVALPEPGESITLTLSADAVLCDVYAFSGGRLPDWVQRWQPPHEQADLLLLSTHADDEHLFFGGAMPLYAGEKDYAVQVAYFTNHRAQPFRQHELLNGLWTVGIRAYPVISDFADYYSESLAHAKTLYPEDEAVGYQVSLLRRFRPLVVLGHDVNGEYGHGVHMYNTYALQQALECSGDPLAFPESAALYGSWDVPKTYLHLYPENPIVMNWNVPLAHFGGKTALEMAKEGYACHPSQIYVGVEDYGLYDCRKFGLYRSTVRNDLLGEDFFENLTVREKPAAEIPQQNEESSSEAEKPESFPAQEELSSESTAPSSQRDETPPPFVWFVICAVLLAMIIGILVFYAAQKRKHRK